MKQGLSGNRYSYTGADVISYEVISAPEISEIKKKKMANNNHLSLRSMV